MDTAFSAPPLVYIDCDIPEGLTVAEWRRLRHPRTARRSSGLAVRHLLRRAAHRSGAPR
jgi:hypothetical protein